MALSSFIFGGNTNETPESLARRREIQDALAAQMMGHAPTTALGGIGALISGAALGIGRYRDNKVQTEGKQKASDLFSSLLGGAKPQDTSATPIIPENSTVAAIPGTMDNARAGDRASVPKYEATQPVAKFSPNDIYDGFMGTVKGKITNPYALAAVASTAQHESAFSPKNANRSWDDGANMAGGIMSWNGPRLNSLYAFAGAKGEKPGAISPQTQAEFFLNENPQLTSALQNAKSVEEAQQLMNRAWAFKGYNQPGGETASRLRSAQSFLPRFQSTDASQTVQQPVQVADNSGALPAQQMQQTAQNTQQPVNALAGVDPRLIQAMANPWISADQKAVIKTMIDQQMQQADPMRGLELKKAQLEVNAMEHPSPSYDFVNGKDGSVFRVDKRTGKMETVYGPQEQVPDAVKALRLRAAAAGLKENTPEFRSFMLNDGVAKDTTPDAIRALDMRAKQSGLQPGTPEYQAFMRDNGAVDKATPDVQEYEYAKKHDGYTGTLQQWILDNKKAGATNVNTNIDQKSEGQFDKTVAEKQAASFNTMADEGMNARADLAVIDQLDGLMKGQGGTITGLSSMVSKWGIPFEGTDDLQAASALINKLVPAQRTPGSGQMSDGDVALFKASLPSLWNQPGGNQTIIDTMRGLAKYKQDQGEIADQVMAGEITRQEGRRMLRALPNPLADFRKDAKKTQDDPNADKPPEKKQPVVINGYTIEEVK